MTKESETQRLDSYDDVMREALELAKPSRTPWVLLVLALLAGAGVAVWLLYKLDRAASDAAAANSGLTDARAQVDKARADLARVEAEKADLLAHETELSRDVQAKDVAGERGIHRTAITFALGAARKKLAAKGV